MTTQIEMPLTTNEVEAAFADGRLRLEVDDPRDLMAIRTMYAGEAAAQHCCETGRFVHVISKPAGGEVRGYVLTDDGGLRVRNPNYSGDWPAMDRAVADRVRGGR